MEAPAVIEIEGLSVRYGPRLAVDGLDLTLRAGEVFGLLGPNGAGKSSTIRVLIGQNRPSAGRVRVLGHDVSAAWDRVKPLFGYVPDRDNHFDDFTGRRNLQFFASLYGVPSSRVRECLDLMELSDAADLPVRRYSLGMRRKLLLARALLHKPRILYLDEPTANLDLHATALVRRVLREHVRDGGTVLLTTHNMQEVEESCDRIAILCRGRLAALDSPAGLRDRCGDRTVEVTLSDGGRRVFDLDREEQRDALAEQVAGGAVVGLQSRAFDLRSAFLKLTGSEWR
jgi:ABC-type multidrug transport system ATPase subunit